MKYILCFFLCLLTIPVAVGQIKMRSGLRASINAGGTFTTISTTTLLEFQLSEGDAAFLLGKNHATLVGYNLQAELHPFRLVSLFAGYQNLTSWEVPSSPFSTIENLSQRTKLEDIYLGIQVRLPFLRIKDRYSSTRRGIHHQFAIYLPFRYSFKTYQSNLYFTRNGFQANQVQFNANLENFSYLGIGVEYYLKEWLKARAEFTQEFGEVRFRLFTVGMGIVI